MARKRRGKQKVVPQTNMINADLWQQHLNAKLDPAKQQALERIVIAGMKVMFDKQTHQMMLSALDGPGNMVDKLAQGITKLMIMLAHQSKGTMPGDLLIPAGGVLLAKASEFLNQSGDQVTEDDFRLALTEMTHLLLKVAGAPDTVTSKLQGQQATPPATNPLNQGVTP